MNREVKTAGESFIKDATGQTDHVPTSRFVRISFPFQINQITRNEIEIEVPVLEFPMLTERASSLLTAGLSDRQADELIDKLVTIAMRESIKAKIEIL